MDYRYSRWSPRRLLIVACGALLACLTGLGVALLTVDPDLTAPRVWRGYYTVLLRSSAAAPGSAVGEGTAALVQELGARGGVEAVVSRYTAEVSFNTFGGFTTTTVDKIGDRLDPEDPRLDPYLAGIASMFSVHGAEGQWEVFYLRSGLARLPARRVLATVLAGHRWAAVDLDGWGALIRVLLLLAFGGVLILRCRSRETAVVIAAGMLPWLAAVLIGTYGALLAFFLVMPLWAELVGGFGENRARAGLGATPPGAPRGSRLDERRLPGWAIAVAAGTAAAVLIMRSGAALVPALLPALSGMLLVPLQYVLSSLASLRRFHPVYRRVPILRRLGREGPWLTRRRVLDFVLVALAVACLAAIGLGSGRRELTYYVPTSIDGAREPISWAALARLAAARSALEPPTLAAYLSHRAYQEGLPFGRPYRFPTPGERLLVSRYLPAGQGAEIIRTQRVVKRYQESWLAETLAAPPPGSVERLLLDQGFPAVVTTNRSLLGGGAAERGALAPHRTGSAWIGASLAVVLFLAAFLFGREMRLTAPGLYVTTSLTLRRHQYPS